jgi:hypothetical protein
MKHRTNIGFHYIMTCFLPYIRYSAHDVYREHPAEVGCCLRWFKKSAHNEKCKDGAKPGTEMLLGFQVQRCDFGKA